MRLHTATGGGCFQSNLIRWGSLIIWSHDLTEPPQEHKGMRGEPSLGVHTMLLCCHLFQTLCFRVDFLFTNIFMFLKNKTFKVIGPKGLHQVAVKATHVYSLCLFLQLFTGTSGCIYSPCPATRTGTGGLATSQFDLQFHLGRLFSVVCRCGVLKMTLCWEICSGFNFLRANGWSGILSRLWCHRSWPVCFGILYKH